MGTRGVAPAGAFRRGAFYAPLSQTPRALAAPYPHPPARIRSPADFAGDPGARSCARPVGKVFCRQRGDIRVTPLVEELTQASRGRASPL